MSMHHEMKLQSAPFIAIKRGTKTIELRLFDEKRQLINLGDTIEFTCMPELTEKLSVEVTGLLRYQNFNDLIADFPLSTFGAENNDKQALLDLLHQFYSTEEEQKYGVLGIKIKLI